MILVSYFTPVLDVGVYEDYDRLDDVPLPPSLECSYSVNYWSTDPGLIIDHLLKLEFRKCLLSSTTSLTSGVWRYQDTYQAI